MKVFPKADGCRVSDETPTKAFISRPKEREEREREREGERERERKKKEKEREKETETEKGKDINTMRPISCELGGRPGAQTSKVLLHTSRRGWRRPCKGK